jgi:hypothetical protein
MSAMLAVHGRRSSKGTGLTAVMFRFSLVIRAAPSLPGHDFPAFKRFHLKINGSNRLECRFHHRKSLPAANVPKSACAASYSPPT